MPTSAEKRVAILGSENSPYVQQIAKSFAQSQLEHQFLSWQQIACCFPATESNPESGMDSAIASATLDPFDAVIVRSMPLGSLEQVIFRMDCLHVAQDLGTLVLNPPRCLEIAIDKWLALHRLQQANLDVPNTIACQTRDQAIEAWHQLGGDVLVKPIFGGEGRGILRVQDEDSAWRISSTLQQLGSVLYLQQFVEHSGYDIRVLFLGEKTWAVKRYGAAGSWRTNVAQGARVEPHELSDQEHSIALRAIQAIGTNAKRSFLGVDLLPAHDGKTYVLEVNAVPGWRGLARALNVDIANELTCWISQELRET
ncbi:MAG: RimK family alpha-L-glutamate ligase [Planctomycetota bacterium]